MNTAPSMDFPEADPLHEARGGSREDNFCHEKEPRVRVYTQHPLSPLGRHKTITESWPAGFDRLHGLCL